jgi:hypothetical protein
MDREWTHKVIAGLWAEPNYESIMENINDKDYGSRCIRPGTAHVPHLCGSSEHT